MSCHIGKRRPPSPKKGKSKEVISNKKEPKPNKKQEKEKKETAFPNRELPRDERTKEPKPDADVPHTQLGMKEGRTETYPQAREFDANGKPVRDIDFTDHGRPEQHPKPHQHEYKENETGGTRQRSKDAKLLPTKSEEKKK